MSENFNIELIKMALATDDDNYTFCITEWPNLQDLIDEEFVSQIKTLNFDDDIEWESITKSDVQELRDFLTDECGD